MKKWFMMALAAAPFFMTSCQSNGPRPNMKTDVDTLSYELGMANTNGIEGYFMQLGIDSANVRNFLEGVKDGALAAGDKKKQAYYAGIAIGMQIKTQMFPGIERQIFGDDTTKTLSLKNFLSGFYGGVLNDTVVKLNDSTVITPLNAGQDINQRMMKIHEAEMEKTYGEAKEQAKKFIADKKAEGYKELPGGSVYKVLTEGNGAVAKTGDKVMVQYEGKLIDGTVFDSTDKNNDGKAVEMTVGHLVPGFNEALKAMPVGSKWEVVIPAEQAYGAQKSGQIPPFSTLIFTVQVEKMTPANK